MKKVIKQPGAEGPEKLLDFKLKKPQQSAAGVKAIGAALADVLEEAGPTRGLKALLKMNKKGGFDCSSCAWPDPDDERSPIGEYCENGAKALADEATTKRLTAKFFAENAVPALAALSDFEIGKKGRLTQPVYLPPGGSHYLPISWDKAFEKIAHHLNELSTPDEAVFYTSGRTSNEASFMYQLFVREFGTNNMPDCSNMCHESTSVGLAETIGIGKGSVTLNDFYKAELILIIGQNPGTNHPRMLSALEKAKRNGAKIIAINPLREAGLIAFKNPQKLKGVLGFGSSLADLYLQVKINGDMALMKAISIMLYQAEQQAPGTVFDKGFIESKTVGYESFIAGLQQYRVEDLALAAGIAIDQLKAAVDMLRSKTRIILCWLWV